jgi:hypothetical protein
MDYPLCACHTKYDARHCTMLVAKLLDSVVSYFIPVTD